MRLGLAVLALVAITVGARADTAADHLRSCAGDRACEAQRAAFTTAFKGAMARDYQGQRNVSFCLVDGCDGAVQVNRPLGCAWRLVIINSGSPQADTTDTGFFGAYCRSRLSGQENDLMYAQARQIFQRVYKRQPPAVMSGASLEPPRR